jgi:hypothetical protein
VVLSFDVCVRAQWGNTPLHKAVFNGNLERVRLLLERGADKEARNGVRAPHARYCRGALRRSAARSALLQSRPSFGEEPRRRSLRRARRVAVVCSGFVSEHAASTRCVAARSAAPALVVRCGVAPPLR